MRPQRAASTKRGAPQGRRQLGRGLEGQDTGVDLTLNPLLPLFLLHFTAAPKAKATILFGGVDTLSFLTPPTRVLLTLRGPS